MFLDCFDRVVEDITWSVVSVTSLDNKFTSACIASNIEFLLVMQLVAESSAYLDKVVGQKVGR